jgi:glycosyltransferase involved in cell wall biosynthesis
MANPGVTLAIPAFNEAKTLARTVRTILLQSFTDFELLLGDNASTDETMTVMKQLAATDSRIRILPSDTNGGAVWNFGRLLDAARGEYFAWIGAHDLYYGNWLEKLLSVISSDEKIVSCFPQCIYVTHDKGAFDISDLKIDTRKMTTNDRIALLCRSTGAGNRIYGLFRTAAIKRIPVTVTIRWDAIFLARLAFLGNTFSINDALWIRSFETPPEKVTQLELRTLERQYRTVFPPGHKFTLVERFAYIDHFGMLMKQAFQLTDASILDRLWAFLAASKSYGRRNLRNGLAECSFFLQLMNKRHIPMPVQFSPEDTENIIELPAQEKHEEAGL